MNKLDILLKNKIACPETGIEIKKTYCNICNQTTHCAIDAYVKDGKVIKIEGSSDSPHTGGTLCPRGAANRQYVFSDQRILYPMKRVGEKGEGKFERISWDEALTTIAEKLNGYKEEFGAKSVGFVTGFEKWYRPTMYRLANQFGTPNFFTEGSTCQEAHKMAWRLVFGDMGGADYSHSEVVMVWSRDPMYSNMHGNRETYEAIEKGLKVIAIDPRITPLTQMATIHLRLKPGTDGALALGMANIIISENLYDKDFVEKYVEGFEEFKELAKEYTPEKVEELTGVDKELTAQAARMYANAKPASMWTSASPVVHHVNGIQNYRAVIALVALTGNYDIIGGNTIHPSTFLHVTSYIPSNEALYMGEKVDNTETIGYDRFPVWGELNPDQGQAMLVPHSILEGKPYQLKALYAAGMNHMMWPDTNYMLKALKNLEFLASAEMFMTETCKYADIVLPVQSSFEREDVKIFPDDYIQCFDPVVAPIGEARNDIEIMMELSKHLGIKDKFLNGSYRDFMNFIIEPTGLTVEMIKENGGIMKAKNFIGSYEEKKYIKEGFKTLSGKVELSSKLIGKYADKYNYDILPVYRSYKEIFPQYEQGDYPLLMNTGSRKPQYMHSRTYKMKWITDLEPIDYLDINEQDAKAYNVTQGDKVVVSTPVDSIEATVNVTIMAQPGVVHMYHGNINADVDRLMDKDFLDPISGYPGFKSFPCQIKKKA